MTKDNGGHLFVPIDAKWLASGTDDESDIYACLYGQTWVNGELNGNVNFKPTKITLSKTMHLSASMDKLEWAYASVVVPSWPGPFLYSQELVSFEALKTILG